MLKILGGLFAARQRGVEDVAAPLIKHKIYLVDLKDKFLATYRYVLCTTARRQRRGGTS